MTPEELAFWEKVYVAAVALEATCSCRNEADNAVIQRRAAIDAAKAENEKALAALGLVAP